MLLSLLFTAVSPGSGTMAETAGKCYLKCDVSNPSRCVPICSVETGSPIFYSILMASLMILLYSYWVDVRSFALFLMRKIESLIQSYRRSQAEQASVEASTEQVVVHRRGVEELNRSAYKAYDCFQEIIRLVSNHELEYLLHEIDHLETLERYTQHSTEARTFSQMQGVLGNAIQMGGALLAPPPVRLPTVIMGAILANVSDSRAQEESRTIEWNRNKFREIFERENARGIRLQDAVKDFDRAVKKLDRDCLNVTGRSLSDPEIRDYVLREVFGINGRRDFTNAARIPALPESSLNENELEILRHSRVLPLLGIVTNFMESESLALLRSLVFGSASFSPVPGNVHLMGGQLAARCLTIYKQCKDNRYVLAELKMKIEYLKEQYDNMSHIHDYLGDLDVREEVADLD